MAVFVSQVVAKSQIQKIFKYQNPTDFLTDLDQFFLSHVKSSQADRVNIKNQRLRQKKTPTHSLDPRNVVF